ncbi:hypothetical protein O181_034569 [Austropuccinia psidii MF-1]|uniref:Phospholipase A-2-activating protein n=1 Tax=Austropuccinia psidii MF-1 TaxID=1389203 RepID=A0A9Q3D115_9BASI|nr:hypothetical protein [Austropuccinia psidii MF-1]
MNHPTQPFRLSATLLGHSQDVKSVKFVHDHQIFSCSRDTTARAWKKADGKPGWLEETLYQNSNPGFLNAVHSIVIDSKEYIVIAGQDALIQIWPASPEPNQPYQPQFVLAGHTSNVCCLDVYRRSSSDQFTIYSGSWDSTAIIWRNNVALHTLRGHSAAVWAVIGVEDSFDSVLTGAADNLIILWRQGKQLVTFKGHTQAVRALVRLPLTPDLFASAGNDATIRIWSLSGHAIRVLDGHDSFIYSMDCLPTGELVSSGEDRTVRVWDPNFGKLTQTITLPAISVWTVSACQENGDFTCGSSDNIVRVFTRSQERLAQHNELQSFEESVKASSVPSATVGDIKKTDLPSVMTLLSRKGKKEGEVAMAKNESNGAIEAYQWDGTKGDWSMVGTVVDAIGSSRKQLFEGKEFDYVFDVDIQDGVPPLKLPYNVSENPYTVAQKWLAKHQLPDSYVEQVVQFIDKNTSGVAIGSQSSGADPLTGANSYRPNSSQAANTSSVGQDPLTAYTSYQASGDGTHSAGSKAQSLLPHKTFLTFPLVNSNFAPIIGKIKEFNSQLTMNELSLDEIKDLEQLVKYLSKPIGIPPEMGVKVLERIISEWPVEKQFPAIDLVRIMAITFFPAQILAILLPKTNAIENSSSGELNFTLTLRAFSNGLSSSPTIVLNPGSISQQDLARQLIEKLWVDTSPQFNMNTKNTKVAVATLLLNLSIIHLESGLDDGLSSRILTIVREMIKSPGMDEEAVYRSVIALGNLLSSERTRGQIKNEEKELLKISVNGIKIKDSEPNRLFKAVIEVKRLIE